MSPSPEFPHSPVDQTAFDKNIESVLEEVEKANLNKNKKMNFKWKSGVSKYIHTYLHLVNIYFEFYGLAECSISRKFYKTYLEVFKSLYWIISIPW